MLVRQLSQTARPRSRRAIAAAVVQQPAPPGLLEDARGRSARRPPSLGISRRRRCPTPAGRPALTARRAIGRFGAAAANHIATAVRASTRSGAPRDLVIRCRDTESASRCHPGHHSLCAVRMAWCMSDCAAPQARWVPYHIHQPAALCAAPMDRTD